MPILWAFSKGLWLLQLIQKKDASFYTQRISGLKIHDKISNLPSFNKNARRIQRLLVGHAEDIDVDSSGRILISRPLREYASLSKKIILIGQGEKFEIWDQNSWNTNVEKWREEATSVDDEQALSDLSI